jgi:hypothetical protein
MFPTRRITTSGGDVFRDEFSLAFDGTNDYIATGGKPVDTADATYVFWTKSPTTTSGSENRSIFAHGSVAIGMFALAYDSNQRALLYLSDSSGANLYQYWDDGAGNLHTSDNKWHHVAVVVDIDSMPDCKLYVDGKEIPQGARSTAGTATAYGNLEIGRESSSKEFTGNLSEFAVYDKLLSASEVKTLYNGREPYNHKEGVCSSNLKAWYRMGDGVLDTKQNSHHYTGIVSDETNPTLGADLLGGKGDFSDPSYWQIHSGQSIVEDNVGKFLGNGSYNAINKTGILTVGKIYRCQLDCTSNAGTAINLNQISFFPIVVNIGETGTHFAFFKAGVTSLTLYAPTNTYGETATIDNVIVQEVNGNAGALINIGITSCFEGDTP